MKFIVVYFDDFDAYISCGSWHIVSEIKHGQLKWYQSKSIGSTMHLLVLAIEYILFGVVLIPNFLIWYVFFLKLIKPEEITNPKVDELSMMTYLSQFPKAKLKPGAPLRPRLNPNRVRAYGPGLEPKGNQVGAPARFTVETFSAGQGSLEVTVLNPKGKKETVSKWEGTLWRGLRVEGVVKHFTGNLIYIT